MGEMIIAEAPSLGNALLGTANPSESHSYTSHRSYKSYSPTARKNLAGFPA